MDWDSVRPRLLPRIAAKIQPSADGCWLWIGGKYWDGYGLVNFTSPRTTRRAHRVVYETVRGPIPKGLVTDHLCRVRYCVNPQHIEIVSIRENLLRGETSTARNAAVTHCPQGHPYDDEHMFMYNGSRCCRACVNARNRAYRHKHSERLKQYCKEWRVRKRAERAVA